MCSFSCAFISHSLRFVCGSTANSRTQLTQADENGNLINRFIHGVDVFDTFALTDNNEGIPINDLQTLHPGGVFTFPLEIIIGLRLTDVDESKHNATISIMLTDKVRILFFNTHVLTV